VERSEAFRIIESLRLGIPPDGAIHQFTVGREEEMEDLRRLVHTGGAGVLYLKANYGSGKTHLLRLLREYALGCGYAVSLVSLDASASIRFNRMDQIVGAIMRGLMAPGSSATGVRPLFDLICREIQNSRARGDTDGYWYRLTNRWRWTESDACESTVMYVALRAWATQTLAAQQTRGGLALSTVVVLWPAAANIQRERYVNPSCEQRRPGSQLRYGTA